MSSYRELDGFILTKKLGTGGYGEVWKCHWTDENPRRNYAMKVMYRLGRDLLEKEIKNLIDLDHPGIVKLEKYGSNRVLTEHPSGLT